MHAPDLHDFHAGQYLTALHPSGIEIPLTIASCPADLPAIELHYRSTPGDPLARAFDELLLDEEIMFAMPQGTVRCPQDTPLLVIAGGTGAAAAFSCAKHRASVDCHSPTDILWCADNEDDFYDQEILSALPEVSLTTIADDARHEGNKGLLWLKENADVRRHTQVIISGSPAFVYTVTDLLLENGFSESQMQSDVYDYAPR